MEQARVYGTGSGITTAGLAFGGQNPDDTLYGNTEAYNGTSWTEVNDLNTSRTLLGSAGTNTAALAFGGGTPPASAATEEWDLPSTLTRSVDTD